MLYYVAYKTILIKEILRFSRIWIQTILPPVITTILYFIIFGQLIGSQLSPIDGYNYIEYITPGLILMHIISNSYANVVSSFYSTKFHHNIEEMLISPTPNAIILLGYLSGGILRGLAVALAVSSVSLLFSPLSAQHPTTIIIVAILTASLFSMGGFINAIFAKSFDDISIIPTFVLTPLTYLGGIFYSISMLPEIWQTLSLGNPILYMINLFRYGFLGISDIPTNIALFIILGFNVLLFTISLQLLNKGIGIKS